MNDDFLVYLSRTPLREVMPSVWYPKFARNTPDILLLRRPQEIPAARPTGKLMDEFKAIFVETVGDRRYVDSTLAKPVTVEGNVLRLKAGIDKTNTRRSELPAQRDFGVLHYAPPAVGWPHLIVLMMAAAVSSDELIRDRYSWSAFPTEDDAVRHLTDMAALIGAAGVPMRI